MKLETRSKFGWPVTKAGYAPTNMGTVVHYNDRPKMHNEDKPHAAHVAYWKGVRVFHMGPERRWLDIGYAYGICACGIVMEGRGFHREQAAQPGGNTTWVSVTFMTGEGEEPTPAQIKAYRELRSWLRGKGMKAGEKRHKDFYSTDCPGTVLSKMVSNGSLRGGTTSTKPPVKPGTKAPTFPLPKGHWYGPQSPDERNHSGYWQKDRAGIKQMSAQLKARGWEVNASAERYTEGLANTIRKFQAEKGLSVDGLTGAKTWAALWESPVT